MLDQLIDNQYNMSKSMSLQPYRRSLAKMPAPLPLYSELPEGKNAK